MPKNKYNHGGTLDFTEKNVQGINKDTLTAPHAHLHFKAAKLADQSTNELLKDFWITIDDALFARFLGFGGFSFTISIDTTGSMGTEIEAVKTFYFSCTILRL